MVATRSKTRTSTGAEDNQPKIDDALEDAAATSTGRKRRSSKATKADGDAGANKKEPKAKKRKTEETSGEKQEEADVEMQDNGKEVIVVEDANGAGVVEEKGETDVAGQEQPKETSEDVDKTENREKEESNDMVDSSRVDLDNHEVASKEKDRDAIGTDNAEKNEKTVEPVVEKKNVDATEDQGEPNGENEAKTDDVAFEEKPDEKATGATDTEDVKEAEKDLVEHDNVTEYGTIHFLYKPKVRELLCIETSPIQSTSWTILDPSLIIVASLQVEVLHPGSVDDVQRLHIILQPHKQDDPSGKPVLSRMLHIGRKVLPAAGKGRRQP
jgi:hypothetical protein